MDSSVRELGHLVREKGIIGAVCCQYLLWWTLQDRWVSAGVLTAAANCHYHLPLGTECPPTL